jgi:riboflavin kinase/FMN adenylyltransferase
VIEIPAEEINAVNVSSTKIRTALLEGAVDVANTYLNKPFELNGKVVRGQQIGRTIGFPTANLDLEESTKLIPANGVYAVTVQLENETKTHFGMMNIGHRPTIEGNNLNDLSLEVHIFDFQNDIYGSELQVELLSFIRDEIQFSGTESLRTQLAADENHCRMLAADFSLEAFTL